MIGSTLDTIQQAQLNVKPLMCIFHVHLDFQLLPLLGNPCVSWLCLALKRHSSRGTPKGGGGCLAAPPPPNQNLNNAYFVDMMISNVSHDLPFSQHQLVQLNEN